MPRPRKADSQATPSAAAPAGAAPADGQSTATPAAPSRKGGRPRKTRGEASSAPSPRGPQRRFGYFDDGTISVNLPACRGEITMDELAELVSFCGVRAHAAPAEPKRGPGRPRKARRGGRPKGKG